MAIFPLFERTLSRRRAPLSILSRLVGGSKSFIVGLRS
nr:MAG TPA: hypothetical protein [Caudoviricetes sp.]